MSLSEMVFIGLLGLVIFGPKKLVEVGQEAGKTLARLKKMSNEFQSQLGSEISADRDRSADEAVAGCDPC
jgi:TatA/E family protein of Tat protein translocase